MARERHQNIETAAAGHHGGVVRPLLPPTRLPADLPLAARESLHETILDVGNRGRTENIPHGRGGLGRDEPVLLEQQVETQQLPHRGGVGVAADRIADALAVASVMFPEPDPTTALRVVKPVRVEHRLHAR